MYSIDHVFSAAAGAIAGVSGAAVGVTAVAAVGAGVGVAVTAGVAVAVAVAAALAAVVGAGATIHADLKPLSFGGAAFAGAAGVAALAASLLANDPATAVEATPLDEGHALMLQDDSCPVQIEFEGQSIVLPMSCTLQ